MNKVVGLDIGKKRIGIAMSDIMGLIAHPVETISREPENLAIEKIKNLCKDNNVKTIVAGLPKNMNNTIGERALVTMEFQKKIINLLNIPVVLQDERLSTVSAHNYLLEANVSRKKRKGVVDKMAANIILQTYLDKEKGMK